MIEHPDITSAMRTGYPRGVTEQVFEYPRGATVDDNAFPFERGDDENDEREGTSDY